MQGSMEGLHYQIELALLRDRVSSSDVSDFIQTIGKLYGDFSDSAAHNVKYPVKYDTESITKMLENMHITPDQNKINAVEAILKPLRIN